MWDEREKGYEIKGVGQSEGAWGQGIAPLARALAPTDRQLPAKPSSKRRFVASPPAREAGLQRGMGATGRRGFITGTRTSARARLRW